MKDKTRILGILALFGVMLVATQCFGQKAEITVQVGNENRTVTEIRVGDLAKIKAPPIDPEEGDLDGAFLYDWRLNNPPEGYKFAEWIMENGKTIIFATGYPGTYEFDLVVVTTKDKAIKVRRVQHKVIVRSISGTIPADPKPIPTDPIKPPPVDPIEPAATQFGLDVIAVELAGKVVNPDKLATAKALAANYESIVGRINSGALADSEAVRIATVQGYRTVLADKVVAEAWEPFTNGIQAEFGKLGKAGKLNSLANLKAVFSEIAKGLRGVK